MEKCYKSALALELKKLGLHVSPEHKIDVLYDGVVVGEYFADLLVEDPEGGVPGAGDGTRFLEDRAQHRLRVPDGDEPPSDAQQAGNRWTSILFSRWPRFALPGRCIPGPV